MHPATAAILRHFEYDHLPEPLKHVSAGFHGLALWSANSVNDDPELTAGLRKLLEAKDCLVRAARVAGMREPAESSPESGTEHHGSGLKPLSPLSGLSGFDQS